MQLTQAGKSSRTQGSISQFHEEIWRTRSQGSSEFPRGRRHVTVYHIQFLRRRALQQELGLHLVEVPDSIGTKQHK
jgi:hypothetical protein